MGIPLWADATSYAVHSETRLAICLQDSGDLIKGRKNTNIIKFKGFLTNLIKGKGKFYF